MLLLVKGHGERLDMAESKGYWFSKIIFSLLASKLPVGRKVTH